MIQEWYEIQVSGSVNAVLLEHGQAWLHAVCDHFDPMMTCEVSEMSIDTPRVLIRTVTMIPHLFAPHMDWGSAQMESVTLAHRINTHLPIFNSSLVRF